MFIELDVRLNVKSRALLTLVNEHLVHWTSLLLFLFEKEDIQLIFRYLKKKRNHANFFCWSSRYWKIVVNPSHF